MRNPFRRQTETAAPTLSERAANLRASLRAAPAAPAPLPVPGSPEAMAAWHAACHEHSKRSAPLHECAELMDPEGGFWTKASLGRALETGGISVAEYARLYPLASERELRMLQIGHELNTAALFALAYADEYPQRSEAQDTSDSPTDLTAAVLNGWAAWGATQDRLRDEGTDAEVEATLAPMNRLVGSVADLPATAENIAAKALAAAWSEWAFSERHEASRSAYPTDERCLFDIHAAIMARGAKGAAGEPRPLDLIASAGLSVEALSISELSALFDAADTLSDVACAMTCQPRHSVKGGDFNGAGLFIESLTHALHRTIEAVAKELRSRTPDNGADRAERLETLARITVQSDDNAETAAFARDLLATLKP